MKVFHSLILLFCCALMSCNRANPDDSRAYIEGKIRGSQMILTEQQIKIVSNTTVIAETFPDGSGSFVLSGPLLSKSYSLVLPKKVKSFSASKSGCIIAPNGKEILIPEGNTYLIFNKIILE